MGRVNILGSSSQSTPSFASGERTVNFYVEQQQSEESPIILKPLPGTRYYEKSNVSPAINGYVTQIISVNDSYAIGATTQTTNGPVLLKITDEDTSSLISGSLAATVTDMAWQLDSTGSIYNSLIVTGTTAYIYDGTTLTAITDADFPDTAVTCCSFNHRFIVNDPANPGRFYVSDALPSTANLLNGSGWTSLLFATAESYPDGIVKILRNGNELWIIGTYSTEIWYDNGSSGVPFAPAKSLAIEFGSCSRRSVAEIAGAVFFVSKTKEGQGQVIMASAGKPTVVSNQSVNDDLNSLTNAELATVEGWCFQWKNNMFYVLNLPVSGGTTWVFNMSNGTWTEWQYEGGYSPIKSYAFFQGVHLVGSRVSYGVIGALTSRSINLIDTDLYAGVLYAPVERKRISSYIHNDGMFAIADTFELLTEFGYGYNSDFSGNLLSGDWNFTDSTGWTVGTNWNIGGDAAIHTAGATATLSCSLNTTVTSENKIWIEIRITDRTAGSITFTIGGATSSTITGDSVTIMTISSSATNFVITPSSDFDGYIEWVNVYPIWAENRVALRWSDDGGNTWSDYKYRYLGTWYDATYFPNATSETSNRAVWRRIGRFRRRLFEISFDRSSTTSIHGAYLVSHPTSRNW